MEKGVGILGSGDLRVNEQSPGNSGTQARALSGTWRQTKKKTGMNMKIWLLLVKGPERC